MHSAIILCLGDKVLREISKEKFTLNVWNKLEALYLTKFVSSLLYMKQKLMSFKMIEDKNISDQIDEINEAIDNLENLEVELGDEDKALILLNALPKSYESFKDTLLFETQSGITLEQVQIVLKTISLNSTITKK